MRWSMRGSVLGALLGSITVAQDPVTTSPRAPRGASMTRSTTTVTEAIRPGWLSDSREAADDMSRVISRSRRTRRYPIRASGPDRHHKLTLEPDVHGKM